MRRTSWTGNQSSIRGLFESCTEHRHHTARCLTALRATSLVIPSDGRSSWVSRLGYADQGEMDEWQPRHRDEFDNVLSEGAWHTAEQVREDLRNYLSRFNDRPNAGELSSCCLPAACCRPVVPALSPPGVLPLYPYLDPDYLSLLLSISSSDKQARHPAPCLREFWPNFAQYPGTRDIPADCGP
jgi:hypothetical protein